MCQPWAGRARAPRPPRRAKGSPGSGRDFFPRNRVSPYPPRLRMHFTFLGSPLNPNLNLNPNLIPLLRPD